MSGHWSRNLPFSSKIWIRLFDRSATYTFRLRSISIECGRLNCPGPFPGVPHVIRNLPFLSNFTMRVLTYPSVSKHVPCGRNARTVGRATRLGSFAWTHGTAYVSIGRYATYILF